MNKALKRSLSIVLAITIIFGSAYAGLSEVEFSGLFTVKAEAASGSETFEFNGHYYQVFDDALLWTDAKIRCEELGGHLVTINSEEENNFIENIISENFVRKAYWIGLIEDATTETLSWVTNEPVDYTNWNTGEPNDATGKEIYTLIYTERFPQATSGKWNDTLNKGINIEDQGFICEWDSAIAAGKIPAFSEEQQEVLDLLAFDVNTILSDINLSGGALDFPSLPIDGEDKDLGSLEASVNLPIGANLTYSVDLNEKRIKILIGLEDDQSAVIGPDGQTTTYWSESYRDVKNMYQNVTGKKVDTTKLWNQFSSLRGQLKKLDCSMGIGVSAKIAGYVELDYSTNKLVFQEGGVVLAVDSSVSFSSNTYPYPGLFVGFGIKPSIGGTLKISNENNVLVFNGNINGDLSAYVELGIGEPKVVKTYIKGGVEGTIGASYSFPSSSLEEGFSAYLSARAYAESKVFGFEVYSDSWDLGKVTLYPTVDNTSLNSIDDVLYGNSKLYLSSATPLTRNYSTDMQSSGESFILDDVYYDSAPQLIELASGQMMLIWTGDDGTKTDNNRTSIFYSIYDGTAWTITQKISNNDCYNSTPVVAKHNDEIYVIWQRTNSPINRDSKLTDALSDIDLYYSVYKDGGFTEERIVYSNDEVAELSYTATSTSDGLNIFWIENSDNNLYGETGTNTLKMVTLDSSLQVSAPVIIAESSLPFGDYSVFDDGSLNVVYTISSSDCDEMYHYVNGETRNIINSYNGINSVYYDGVQIVYLDGGQIKTYNIETNESTVLVDNISLGCSFFNDNESAFIVSNQRVDDQYYINVVEYNPLTNAILRNSNIYRSDKYIVDYDIVVNEYDEYIVAMNSCVLDLDATEIFSNYTLNVNYGQQYSDISVNNIAWCYDDISTLVSGDSATLNFEVQNKGNYAIDTVNYTLVNNSNGETLGSGSITTYLSAGEIGEFSVDYIIPEEFSGCDIRIDISLDELEQNNEDNSTYIKLGLADLELYDVTSEYINGDVYVTCKIKNSGYTTVEASKLNVYARGKEGDLVQSIEIESLAYNDEEIISFILPENYCASIDENQLCSIELNVVCDNLEEDNENNNYIYIYDNLLPFEFELNEDGSGLIITGYSGTSSIVDIPKMISGVYVKQISSEFMNGNSYAKTINIPSTIEIIDGKIFNGATALSEIIIDDESVNYCVIDGVLYNYDKTKIIRVPEAYAEEDFEFLDSVVEIGEYAFYGCENFNSVAIPDNITRIGAYAFNSCNNIADIQLPNSALVIGRNAFSSTAITELTLPENIVSIGICAFSDCTKLQKILYNIIDCNIDATSDIMLTPNPPFINSKNITEVTIGENVKAIPSYMFTGQSNIVSVYISSLEQLCSIDFRGSSGNPLAFAEELYLNGALVTDIVIPETVETINKYVFYAFAGFSSVTIPYSVKNIDTKAFYDCSNLKYAFYTSSENDWNNITICTDNTSLTSLAIHYESIDHIFSSEWTVDVFATCTESGSKSRHCFFCDRNIDVTVVEATGHSYSEDWTIDVAATCTEEGSKSHHCTGCNDKTDITVISATGHSYSEDWTIDVAATCTEEGSKSHHCVNCDDYTDVTVVDALGHNYGDWNVTLEATCTTEGDKYKACLVCSDTVIEVIPVKGHNYSKEWTIDVSSTCTEDGSKSHHCMGCDDKIDITVVKATGHCVSNDICTYCGYSDVWIYNLYDDYAVITGYNGDKADVIIPGSIVGLPVTGIGNVVFDNYTNLVSVTIPDSVTSIGGFAFRKCTNLVSISIPDNVEIIHSYAFYGCTNLSSIVVPKSLINVGVSSFTKCSNLKYVFYTGSETDWTNIKINNNNSAFVNAYVHYNSTGHNYVIQGTENIHPHTITYKCHFCEDIKEETPIVLDCVECVDEIKGLVQGTIDTNIYYENFIIRTSVESVAEITDILAFSDSVCMTTTPSYKYGDMEFYGTGTIITVFDGNQYIGDFTLVVDGDTNGDSVCDALDAAQVALVSNGQGSFDGVYALAADSNLDDVVDINDYQAIVNKVVS